MVESHGDKKGLVAPGLGRYAVHFGERAVRFFGPQPRSYGYALPKKVSRGALRAAVAQRMQTGALVVVNELALAEMKTKLAVELLEGLGANGKTLLVDVKLNENILRSVRNLPAITIVATQSLTARDVVDAPRLVVTKAAIERLQEVLES